jgi:hypothetical protein
MPCLSRLYGVKALDVHDNLSGRRSITLDDAIMRYFFSAFIMFLINVPALNAEDSWVSQDAVSAFSTGTEINIHSVEEVAVDSLNSILIAAQKQNQVWTKSFVHVAVRLCGEDLSGADQFVSVYIEPAEWHGETGAVDFARVTVRDEKWLDDATSGERFMLWLVPDRNGYLNLKRMLWAKLCSRPYWRYYSSGSCP